MSYNWDGAGAYPNLHVHMSRLGRGSDRAAPKRASSTAGGTARFRPARGQ
jgi:hypothetical protein